MWILNTYVTSALKLKCPFIFRCCAGRTDQHFILTNLQYSLFSLEWRASKTDSKRIPDIYYETVSFLSDLLQKTELSPPARECTPCHLELCILQHNHRTASVRKVMVWQTLNIMYTHHVTNRHARVHVHIHSEGERESHKQHRS